MIEPEEEHARANTRWDVPRRTVCVRLWRDRECRGWPRYVGRSAFYFLYTARDPHLNVPFSCGSASRSGVRCSTHGTMVSIRISMPSFHQVEGHRGSGFRARPQSLAPARYGRWTRPAMTGGMRVFAQSRAFRRASDCRRTFPPSSKRSRERRLRCHASMMWSNGRFERRASGPPRAIDVALAHDADVVGRARNRARSRRRVPATARCVRRTCESADDDVGIFLEHCLLHALANVARFDREDADGNGPPARSYAPPDCARPSRSD